MPMEPPHCHRPSFSSPSFSGSFSSETIAQLAARVIHELNLDPIHNQQPNDADHQQNDDFEFEFVSKHPHPSPVSADDIFRNGRIIPNYPISVPAPFDATMAAVAAAAPVPAESTASRPRRLPLRKLMIETEGRDGFGSAGGDDLAGVAEGSYCVWKPPCKKSSSKRWKLLDLLHRSHSDGGKKESLMRMRSGGNGGGAAALEKVGSSRSRRRLFMLPHRPEVVNRNGPGRKSQPI